MCCRFLSSFRSYHSCLLLFVLVAVVVKLVIEDECQLPTNVVILKYFFTTLNQCTEMCVHCQFLRMHPFLRLTFFTT